jgi:hypothetical protein
MFGQTVSSSVVGSVVDPADAVVSGAPTTLTSVDTGAVRTATTDSLGTYRFTEVPAGTYNVTVKATGFKSETQTGIVVTAQETHNAGKMILALGSVSDSISVTAEAAQVQLSSSEKSQTVDSAALDDLTLKGRDLFGYIRLVPGVIDTANRDVTSHGAISGMNINGGFTALNFTVDGVTDMDTGSNTSLQVEPNLDSVQELKVLTSNFQAEFGHNSGGTITVVTKNGTQEFHGTAAWNHRHEEFNADTWANNHTLKGGVATPRVPYRYNVETYSIGGPVFIPKHFNRDRKKLFFFWSQERTGQFVSGGTALQYTPTALERVGDFSQSFNNNGTPIVVLDPATVVNGVNQPFPNNMIPASRLNPIGQSLLNFFPLPNFTATLPTQVHVDNYTEQASAIHPRLNSVARADLYINSKMSGYVRWLNDADYMYVLYDGVQFSNDIGGTLGTKGIAPIIHPNGGHSDSGTLTYTISPTLVNETTLAYNWDQYTYETTDNFASEARSLVPNLPSLFPIPKTDSQGPINGYAPITLLPTFSFGTPSNAMSYGRTGASAGQEIATNPTWYYMDNISKVAGHHSLKAGIYVEFNTKYQCACKNYTGAYSFSQNSAVPLLNTNDGFANALLGNVNSYNQNNIEQTFNVVYENFEEYVQDNWKVNRRLTLDLGMRFYHQSPQEDNGFTFVNFVPSLYSKSAEARLYVPFCSGGTATCSANNGLVARDPGTGATVGSSFIGDLVPNSGTPASGEQSLGGPAGTPEAPYHTAPLVFAPRVGFAYDVMGDGKTALRGGWGIFYNRLDGNQYYPLSGQAPTSYNVGVSTLTLAQIAAQNTGAVPSISTQQGVTPFGINSYPAQVPWDTVQSASLGLQHTFGSNLVVDIGYTLQYVYHEHIATGCCDINYIPIGTGWPFTPSNLDPTTGGASSNSINSNLLRTIYPGYGNIEQASFQGHSSYNALTSTVTKRYSHGLSLGTSFTYSKAMGTTSFNPVVPNNEEYNYGRIGTDRPINLQVSYSYDLPGIAKKMGWKGVGYVTDHWQLSGITSIQSGSPYNPSCGLTSGQNSPTGGYTGTPDLGTRCQVIGNPLTNLPTNGNGQVYFNPSAFALPALATGPDNSIVGPPAYGNLGGGAGVFDNPRVTNFDMTMTKIIPLGSEKRVLKIQAQAYNVFNHAEFSGINSGIQFNPTTNQVSNLSSLGYVNGTVSGSNRIMAFSARLQF